MFLSSSWRRAKVRRWDISASSIYFIVVCQCCRLGEKECGQSRRADTLHLTVGLSSEIVCGLLRARYRLSRCLQIVSEHPKNKIPRTSSRDAGLSLNYLYLAFFALNFAHLARCAAAILSRAAAESLRIPRPAPLDFPATPLNASIALSNFARSAFNCATTALRSAILCSLSY